MAALTRRNATRRVCVTYVALLALLLLCLAPSARGFFGSGNQRAQAPPAQAKQAPEVDHYKVLKLEMEREAVTEKDIRQQFRKLSRLYHPDVAKTEEDKARYGEVNRAYEVLSDKRKRKAYDMRGERGLEQLEQLDRAKDTPGGGMNPLAQLFGMQADDGLRGPNMEVEARVDLSKVFTGSLETLRLNKHKVCHKCKGTGADPTAGVVQCRQCNGHGVLRQRIQFAPGMVQEVQQHCPSCGGTGKRPERVCPVCHGKKVVYGSSAIDMELEAGTPEGHELRFEMEAEESPDRLPGDLIVRVHTHPHPVFTRRRNQLDLDTSLTLTLREALLGFNRNITHLDGVEQVRVQRDSVVSPYGMVMRLPGKGMPKLHVPSERGDMYVRLQYELPTQLTAEQQELAEKML